MNNLLIIGAGGHGQMIKEIALSLNKYSIISFVDDNVKSLDVIGECNEIENLKAEYMDVFVSFGNAKLRKEWVTKCMRMGFNLPNIISPYAIVCKSLKLGKAILIAPGAIINSNVDIDDGVIISSGAIIDHNSHIEEYCHINCGAVVTSYTTIKKEEKINYNEVK